MKEVSGSYTVEASALVPFLLAVCVIFIYLGIYSYDKTLMIQDVNAIAAMIKDEKSAGDKDVITICEEAFSKIKKEHPYISTDNLRMDVSVKGNKVFIRLSAEWKFPLYRGYGRTIYKEREIKRINPIEKMYLTDILMDSFKGENNDNRDDIRD